jgi:hypothetical protein
MENGMKVYSLVSFVDYEGYYLVGVYGSLEDLMKYVEDGKWYVDRLGYVESELGEELNVLAEVVYVPFVNSSNEQVMV